MYLGSYRGSILLCCMNGNRPKYIERNFVGIRLALCYNRINP